MLEYQGFIGIAVGILILGIGPYLLVAFQTMMDKNEWKLPRYEPKYVAVMALAAIGYGVTIAVVEEFRLLVMAMPLGTGIVYGLTGKGISREAVRLFEVVANYIKKRGNGG